MDNPMDQIMGLQKTTFSKTTNPMDQIMGINSVGEVDIPQGTDYITQKAQEAGLDPQAVLGVAQNEGLSGGVGDNGTSFGPFQLHAGGALPAEVWQKGADYAKQWAWSPEGIDYALKKMADNGARGRKGADAVRSIVLDFERPADPTGDLRSGYNAVGGQ